MTAVLPVASTPTNSGIVEASWRPWIVIWWATEFTLGNEVVVLDGEVTTEISPDHLDDLLPALSTLAGRTGGMIHHVFSNELVDH